MTDTETNGYLAFSGVDLSVSALVSSCITYINFSFHGEDPICTFSIDQTEWRSIKDLVQKAYKHYVPELDIFLNILLNGCKICINPEGDSFGILGKNCEVLLRPCTVKEVDTDITIVTFKYKLVTNRASMKKLNVAISKIR